MGPLFACIIKQQFEKLRNGDRFFFSHSRTRGSHVPGKAHPQGLPDVAKRNIQGRSLGAIFCDNLEPAVLQSKTVGRNVFKTSDTTGNRPLLDDTENCTKHKKLDLRRIFLEAVSEEQNGLLRKSQHEVAADVGFVTSPNYPNNYLANADTQDVVTADAGNVLELTLESFKLERDPTGQCRFDRVEIWDGKGRLAILCGTLPFPAGSQVPKFTSRDNRLTVKFHSDSTENHKGFKFSWKEIKPQVKTPRANYNY